MSLLGNKNLKRFGLTTQTRLYKKQKLINKIFRPLT